jgi:subtilisin family serine protease
MAVIRILLSSLVTTLALTPLTRSQAPFNPLRVESIDLPSEDELNITLSGPTNRVFVLEYSADLRQWQPTAIRDPEVIGNDGSTTIRIGMPDSPGHAYYRAFHRAVTEDGLIDRIEGPVEAPANEYLPELAMPVEREEEVLMVNDELPVSGSHILAILKDDTTVRELNELLVDSDVKIAGTIPVMKVVTLRGTPVADAVALDERIETLKATGLFAAVAVNLGLSPPRPVEEPAVSLHWIGPEPGALNWTWDAPPLGTGTGGNNALELSRIPQLWNWLDYGRRQVQQRGAHPISIMEFNFRTPHEDEPSNLVRSGGTGSGSGRHGIAVLGVAAANGQNDLGLQGVTSLADPVRAVSWVTNTTGVNSYAGPDLGQMAAQICRASASWVINESAGMSYRANPATNRISSGSTRTYGQWMDGLGELWANAFQSANQACGGHYLIITSAGNDSGVDTRYNSPIANIACRKELWNLTANFLTVENVTASGTTSTTSNRDLVPSGDEPGHAVSAGGTQVGLLGSSNASAYRTGSGTSFAAPLVSGLASLLWTLDPDLTVPQLKGLLLDADTTRTVSNTSSELVDGFAAALQIDKLRGDLKLQRALVDVDDGTLDGNLREKAQVYEKSPDKIHSSDLRRGDGVIDMKDFRAFRDAYVQAAGVTDFLDGSTNHFKRDLNLDGLIAGRPVSPGHPVDIPARTARADSPDEGIYSRYDFNGNGTLDVGTIENQPNPTALAPFKTDPDTDCPVRDVQAGCWRDLDPLLEPDLWELTEENVEIQGVDQFVLGTSTPPADWTQTTVHFTNFFGGVIEVDYVPYLWSCDLHLDMEAADGGGLTTALGTPIPDGLWIRNPFTFFSKGRSGDWQGVVTVPLVHPDHPIAAPPSSLPFQILIQYQKSVGPETHAYLLNLNPGPGEDVSLSLGFDRFNCISTTRETDAAFWPRESQSEVLVRKPEAGPYTSRVISAAELAQAAEISAAMAQEALMDRMQLPVVLGDPTQITGLSETKPLDDDRYRLEVRGLAIVY